MKQIQTDVAIIGAGVSGLAAAISVVENGGKAVLFEKAPITGGTGNMGMGPFAVGSRLQKSKQIPLTVEDAFKIFMDYTHYRVDARLVSNYIRKSASTIDWLEKMGVEFLEPSAYFPGCNFTWHLVKGANGRSGPQAAATMTKHMTETAQELGVQIFLQTPATIILKEGNKVVGLTAKDKNGEDIEVKAKAVIIASGGFGDSPEFIKDYTGFTWGKDIFTVRIPGLIGEGIKMAWEAGAGTDGMYMELNYGLPVERPPMDPSKRPGNGPPPVPPAGLGTFREPNLMVNLEGERFMNEETMLNPTYTGNSLSRQKERCGFNIFDANSCKYFEENGLDFDSSVNPGEQTKNMSAELQNIVAKGFKHIFIADSLDELAAKARINAANLKKTVEEYNKACDKGYDDLFFKKTKFLRPVRTPKFYAGRLFPAGYGSRGGIKINHRTEVLTPNMDIIPGLYAAGVDANSIHGDTYVMILAGGGMGFALNSGRIAGENAMAFSKGK
jgi:fumarate reductase flavoprotein subunit